jgi:hypothetical protein
MMSRMIAALGAMLLTTSLAPGGEDGTPTYDDATGMRMPVPPNDPAVTTEDENEKSFAWGDLDLDGDLDLVCVRKIPFSQYGPRRNVLLMNEGLAEGHAVDGVLVDRTAQLASASDVTGDRGMLAPTNDRDVVLADVDDDGWLDIVTAVTLGDGEPKSRSTSPIRASTGISERSMACGRASGTRMRVSRSCTPRRRLASRRWLRATSTMMVMSTSSSSTTTAAVWRSSISTTASCSIRVAASSPTSQTRA